MPKEKPPHPCPVCRFLTIQPDRLHRYDICPVCFWEDDPTDFDHPDLSMGANGISLLQARKNFKIMGACEEKHVKNTRAPKLQEYYIPCLIKKRKKKKKTR